VKILRADLLAPVNSVARGTTTWEQASAVLPVAKTKFQEGWQAYLNSVDAKQRERLQNEYKTSLTNITDTFAEWRS